MGKEEMLCQDLHGCMSLADAQSQIRIKSVKDLDGNFMTTESSLYMQRQKDLLFYITGAKMEQTGL